jgi:hypothetical protein
VGLTEQLEGSESVIDFATRLGKVCLSNARKLTKLEAKESVRPYAKELEDVVAAMDQDLWLNLGPGEEASRFLGVDGFGESVAFAEAHHPIEHLAVLRGLFGVLRRFYDEVDGKVAIDSGTPVPVATRRVNDLFPPTTKLETLRLNDLLRVTGADGERYHPGLYLPDFGLDDRVPIVLDFGQRRRLDELTWTKEERLPRIATVHPPLGQDGIVIDETTASTFFGVHPRNWDLDGVVEQLQGVASDVEIAVLPELSLPEADALEDALAADPGSFPAMVVAGSAHLSECNGSGEAVRANESRIYLDGRRVATHRKIHPYVLKSFQGATLSTPLMEGITNEEKSITILAGDRTRLAVAICADILDSRLPKLLEEAGVNLLLVPALTKDTGSFNGGICGIASQTQGVTVVVNGDGAALVEDGEMPFMVMAGVPRPSAGEQSREYHRPDDADPPYTGLLDPNLPLDDAFSWR